MALFNDKRAMSVAHGHRNFMGGVSYDVGDPVLAFKLAAASCFFGEPMYYHRDAADTRPSRSGARRPNLTDDELAHLRSTLNALDPRDWRDKTPAERMESAIDAALAHDAERTLIEAARLRNDEHIRTTPQVVLVRAAHHPSVRGTTLVRRYAREIVQRADEPAVGLAYQMYRYGKPIPNSLKRAWRDALSRFDDYALAKYRLEAKTAKTVDVVNLVHPKSPSCDRLAKGELVTTDRTWEAVLSAKGSSKESWHEALPLMGHLALLRNLRNFLDAKVDPQRFLPRLIGGVERGHALPFRYASAYFAIAQHEGRAGDQVREALEQCIRRRMGALPRFQGRLMALSDNSGSARGATTSSMGTMQIATIGNLTSILAAKCASEGHVGVFGDSLETFRPAKKSSIFQELENADRLGNGVGGGTENGIWLFLDRAIRAREHWDHLFVFSDMQAGHGGLYGTNKAQYADYLFRGHYIDVAKLVAEYRKRVNPHVFVYLVQIAGYRDTLIPELYDRTFILGGWGEGLLRFAGEMSTLAA